MVLPIAGAAGRGITFREVTSSSSNNIPCDASVMLDPSALNTSSDFEVVSLGATRHITVGMELLTRGAAAEVEECVETLGETDLSVVEHVERYISYGYLPESPPCTDLFVQLAGLDTAAAESTRESRMQSVLEAGMKVLKTTKGPGLNLLNIAGRTGLIIALTTVLRQVVGYYVEQAIREGNSPEASQAWAVVSVTMIGPALTLMGALRNEYAGTASLKSRLGRIGMASITMGALIAGHLTGASKNLLPVMLGGTVYTVARGLANAFFPLRDNAGAANALTTGVTTAAYGAAQFALAELGRLSPLSGPARAAAELGYSLEADAIQGGLNALGIVMDDVVSILCKSCHLLSPSAGLDSVFSDPESLRQTVLEVRAGVQLPTRTQLADALFDVGALRLSAGHAISLVVAAVASLLSDSEMGDNNQSHILNGCLAMMLMLIYFPLVFGCAKRTDNTYSLGETVVP